MPQSLFEIRKGVVDPLPGAVIETLYKEEHFFLKFPIEGIDGMVKPYDVEKALPGVSFRKINEAYSESIGVVQRNVETLKPLGGDSKIDTIIDRAYKGERRKRDKMFIKAMAVKWIQTILYGNSPLVGGVARAGSAYNDLDGFDGLMRRFTDAGGTQIVNQGANSGSDGSSVFALRLGEEYISGLMMNPTPYFDVRDLGETTSGPPQKLTRIEAAGGMAIYNGMAGAWLKNISVGVPITQAKLDEMIRKVVGTPDLLLMTKRTRDQLKAELASKGLTFGRSISELGLILDTYGTTPIITSDAMLDTEVNG